jgi:hypothetical protein
MYIIITMLRNPIHSQAYINIEITQFSKEMSTYYSGKLMNQLIHIRNSETGKLRFFSKILTTFQLQKYLTHNPWTVQSLLDGYNI